MVFITVFSFSLLFLLWLWFMVRLKALVVFPSDGVGDLLAIGRAEAKRMLVHENVNVKDILYSADCGEERDA